MEKTRIFEHDKQDVRVRFTESKTGIWQYNASCKGKRFRKSTKEQDFERAKDVLRGDLDDIVKDARGILEDVLTLEDIWDAFLKKRKSKVQKPTILIINYIQKYIISLK